MEPEGSLPHSQVPTTCPYTEPAQSSPYPHTHFMKINLNIIPPPMLGGPQWSLTLRSPHHNLEKGRTINSARYSDLLANNLMPAVRTKRRGLLSKTVVA
jgi:hypothetical protein